MERRAFLGALAATAASAVPDLQAQTAASPAAVTKKKPLTITLLGTGTPAPSLERQGSSFLFEVGDDLIVMDHGPGAHHRLLESGHRARGATCSSRIWTTTTAWITHGA